MERAIRNPGRVAGLLYLLLVLAGPFRVIYIPSRLFVHGNATATAANIAAHETLFRAGIVTDLVATVILIFLTLALYRLFKGVSPSLAALVVILGGLMPAAIYFFNSMNDVAALTLVRGPEFLSAIGKPERDALAMFFLNMHGQVWTAGEIYYGLWLFPLGILTYRSRMLPRFLGVWLIVNGFAYLTLFLAGYLFPRYEDPISTILFPILFGEIAFMLWLVIFGSREPRPAAAA